MNQTTSIEFYLPEATEVRIDIYNNAGQKVTTLINKNMQAGNHQVKFNGQNLSSGIYLYRIEAGEWQDVKKMVLLQ
jgi:flagellar hook assembly protein FlgD